VLRHPLLASSAKSISKSRECAPDAGGNDGAQQASGGDRSRRYVRGIRACRQGPLEIARKHVGQAPRQIAEDRAPSELRERPKQDGADRNVDPQSCSCPLSGQRVFNLGIGAGALIVARCIASSRMIRASPFECGGDRAARVTPEAPAMTGS
jgi:hypothetical protein